MSLGKNFLKVDGEKIFNQQEQEVRLRGFCLGGYLHMENFMLGYPGHEAGMREAIANELGLERAAHFFTEYRKHFFKEEDVKFIRDLGCNTVRVALNYREFESDDSPYAYKESGFKYLDQLVAWGRNHNLYMILDLHAVQGWQNSGWHSDNFTNSALFWGQKVFEDRAVALWEEIACRYRGEEFIAGYNLANEPNTTEIKWLNQYYERVTQAIREIDPDHILFYEGNRDSQQFDGLNHPFDDNAVYSSHLYVLPGTDLGEYPGEFAGIYYDKDQLRREYEGRREFSQRHGVPHWLGEFGPIYSDPVLEKSRLKVMADMLNIIEEFRDHWTIWNYKDIGLMGVVSPKKDSDWMRKTEPVRRVKTALRCDHWIERKPAEIDDAIEVLSKQILSIVKEMPGYWDEFAEQIQWRICDGLISQYLQPAFASQFRGITDEGIKHLMKSFSLEECEVRVGLINLIRETTAGENKHE
ncbi:MAG: cellulase family glycosylhydrolase [Anaerolineales bacterium]|nr:cellulase family glycosylhydrolase [Anaerolineales bacterium]